MRILEKIEVHSLFTSQPLQSYEIHRHKGHILDIYLGVYIFDWLSNKYNIILSLIQGDTYIFGIGSIKILVVTYLFIFSLYFQLCLG